MTSKIAAGQLELGGSIAQVGDLLETSPPAVVLQIVRFWVAGLAKPKGSHRAFYNARTGRSIVTNDNPKTRGWEGSVATAGRLEMALAPPLQGPLAVTLVFHLPRPTGHFDKRGQIRRSAPPFPAVKPDIDKVVRSTLDGMTGIVFQDDARVVKLVAEKRYAHAGTGVHITVEELAT